jgi:hypothetical protein
MYAYMHTHACGKFSFIRLSVKFGLRTNVCVCIYIYIHTHTYIEHTETFTCTLSVPQPAIERFDMCICMYVCRYTSWTFTLDYFQPHISTQVIRMYVRTYMLKCTQTSIQPLLHHILVTQAISTRLFICTCTHLYSTSSSQHIYQTRNRRRQCHTAFWITQHTHSLSAKKHWHTHKVPYCMLIYTIYTICQIKNFHIRLRTVHEWSFAWEVCVCVCACLYTYIYICM